MGKYSWGKRSVKNIQTVNPMLQEVAARMIEITTVDVGVLDDGGYRTAEMQNNIFKTGASKCDGYKKLSYHQSGLAIDFVPYINGRYTWASKGAFLKIAKAAFEAWDNLPYKEQGYHLHWGGFWKSRDVDGDGKLTSVDVVGWDQAHWEIRRLPQVAALKVR